MSPVSMNPADWLAQITVSNWKSINKKGLIAEFTLTLGDVLVIQRCRYFEGKAGFFVRAPQWEGEDGTFRNYVEFTSSEHYQAFQREALKAVNRYLEAQRHGLL